MSTGRGNWGNGGVPKRVRRIVLARDHHTCQLAYPGCTGQATEVDDIIPVSVRGIPRSQTRPEDCQAVCAPCHRQKTQREAQAGRNRWRRQPRKHPSDA
ncbi:HNH endonuclease signature motif containing protein [Mycolicibacillus trivialis]